MPLRAHLIGWVAWFFGESARASGLGRVYMPEPGVTI